jgi:hypothetical protein
MDVSVIIVNYNTIFDRMASVLIARRLFLFKTQNNITTVVIGSIFFILVCACPLVRTMEAA